MAKMFLFQPTGSGKFESFEASRGTSDNQSTKTKHWAQETEQFSQIDVLPSLRKATAVSGEAGQNYFLNKLNRR